MKQRIMGIPPHFSLVLSLMLITFGITDQFNSAMAFINHPMTKRLIAVLVIFNLLSALRAAFLKYTSMQAARTIIGIAIVLFSTSILMLLCMDSVDPTLLLFTQNSIKALLLLFAACSVFVSVFFIVCQRKAAISQALVSEDPPTPVIGN